MHESVMNEMCIPLCILCCTRLGEPQKYATKRGLESLAPLPPQGALEAAAPETTHATA